MSATLNTIPASPAQRTRRWHLWIITLLATLLALILLIYFGQGDQRQSLVLIWSAAAILFAALTAMAYLLHTTLANAKQLPRPVSAALILLVAILARAAIFQWWTPSLSDDLFRYRHEGRLVLHGIQPYSYIPAEAGVRIHPYTGQPIGILAHQTDLIDRMSNNGELPAVYFPMSQFAFAAAAWCEEHFISAAPIEPGTTVPSGRARDALWLRLAASPAMKPYRLIGVISDSAVVILLLLTLQRVDRSLWWAALYAWNPLPLIEASGNAHFEPLGIAFLLAAIYVVVRGVDNPGGLAFSASPADKGVGTSIQPSATLWRYVLATILLAAAFLVKPIALVAFPALLLYYWRTEKPHPAKSPITTHQSQIACPIRHSSFVIRHFITLSLIYALTIILAFLPFAAGLHDLRLTTKLVANNFEFNGAAFEFLRWFIFSGDTWILRTPLNILNLVALALVLLYAYCRRWPLAQTLGHATFLFIIFAIQVYPWYALWCLALVPLYFNRASWALSLTILLSYAVWFAYRATGQWELPIWAYAMEWLPVVVLEAMQLWKDAEDL
jgi:hypothetical protein